MYTQPLAIQIFPDAKMPRYSASFLLVDPSLQTCRDMSRARASSGWPLSENARSLIRYSGMGGKGVRWGEGGGIKFHRSFGHTPHPTLNFISCLISFHVSFHFGFVSCIELTPWSEISLLAPETQAQSSDLLRARYRKSQGPRRRPTGANKRHCSCLSNFPTTHWH